MRKLNKACLPMLTLALVLFLVLPALTQDAVPVEILNRTLLIQVGDKFGTAFIIDYEGMLYIVTARHVVEGLPDTKAVIQVKRAKTWMHIETVKTLFPLSNLKGRRHCSVRYRRKG